MRKEIFYWASIAGAAFEPVEVVYEEKFPGRKGILTIGCPDIFWLDDLTANIRLSYNSMTRPVIILTEEERLKRQEEYDSSPRKHSWRGSR